MVLFCSDDTIVKDNHLGGGGGGQGSIGRTLFIRGKFVQWDSAHLVLLCVDVFIGRAFFAHVI